MQSFIKASSVLWRVIAGTIRQGDANDAKIRLGSLISSIQSPRKICIQYGTSFQRSLTPIQVLMPSVRLKVLKK